MTASIGIVVFPGSNCEQDCDRAFRSLGAETQMIWHGDESLPDVDLVILPGGFAHGDYLRTGAIARFSPIMDAVVDFARDGGLLLGICNGFQVLCEAGLLPGAMRKNAGLKFLCKWTDLEVQNTATPFTSRATTGQRLKIPINHFEGNWYCDDQTFGSLKANDQVVFTYVDNPNGSLNSVAGISNETGNVLGLMPHPERACEALLGSEDGRVIFGSVLDHVDAKAAQPA
jgi:phosphoribosylformylglycinamidine synthase subunit PurQ / glutaminase